MTAEHLKHFEKQCIYWREKFGLRDWRLYVRQRDSFDGEAHAWADIKIDDLIAKIYIAKEWFEPITEESLNSTALHEILHVVLRPLVSLITDDCEQIEHAIIHRLCHAMLGVA